MVVSNGPPSPNEEADHRSLMFSIAYRMTGSVTDAEDLVQEAYFRISSPASG